MRKFAVAALILGALTFVASGNSWADMGHLDAAVNHAQEAVVHGKKGNPDALAVHAEYAMTHARDALQERNEQHIEPALRAGVRDLHAAAFHGRAGHTELATRAAEEAVRNLNSSRANMVPAAEAVNHGQEAMNHAHEAVAAGKRWNPDALADHAGYALEHADNALQEKRKQGRWAGNVAIEDGIKSLRSAITHGRNLNVDLAIIDAEMAVSHFSRAIW